MILSQKNIEEIAVAVIRDFQKSFFGSEADDPARFALPTPIDQFASDYLNLKVSFQKLSSDGSIYGLTAYVDTEYQIDVDGSQRSIFLKINDVVLDKSFIEPANIRKLCGKRRFTLAHECAHQILFQLDSDERKIACHKRPEVREKGSRVLRTQEDWNEWQANSLGAAILMPQSEVDRAMWFINSRKPLTCYGWRFYDSDQVKIDTFCGVFAPFLNIMNEWYAKDTSNKIKAVFDARMKDGKRCSGSIPYGYNRLPNDKQTLVVDPLASEVVKRIFLLANEGKSPRTIAELLTEEKVLIPAAYAKKYHPEQYNGTKFSNAATSKTL